MNFIQGIKKTSSSVLDIIYPNHCCICKTDLNTAENFVCLACAYDLPYISYKDEEVEKLSKIFWGRTEIENVYSLLNYQKGNQIQTILHEIKYKGKLKLAGHFGQLLSKHIPMDQIDLVIPLPLHPKKQRERGYNQSTAIAKGIVAENKIILREDCIRRTTHNQSQTQFSKYDRWENVRSIFQIAKVDALENKHVLLVDDVLTTGATLEACAQKLNELNDCTVSVATLAVRL